MLTSRKLFLALGATAAVIGAGAAPSQAIVGGSDVPAGQYTNVAEITLGAVFGCSGTLIAPTWVLTAGHCGSITGAAVSTPVAWPPQAIDVLMGSNKSGKGSLYPVAEVIVPPDYLITNGNDISLLRLASPVTDIAPVPVANASERALWDSGTVQTIVGWGVTEADGNAPDTLQEAKVPVTTDPYCENAYGAQSDSPLAIDGFDPNTMVCAGFPAGGVDTCQGDSGGPMFAQIAATGALRLAGATSWGQGCAEPDHPGVYARVADTVLRSWIASFAPGAIAG